MPPFSGKQKKKQLQEKRQRKKEQEGSRREHSMGDTHDHSGEGSGRGNDDDNKDHHTKEEYKYDADRRGVRSVFLKETAEEIAARKKLSYEPLASRRFMDDGGIPFGSWFDMPGHTDAAQMPCAVEIPTRGWTPNDEATAAAEETSNTNSRSNNKDNNDSGSGGSSSRDGEEALPEDAAIEAREAARFEAYLRAVDNYPLPPSLRDLRVSSYERNLDVWRQLWRTVEQSDVVVIVADMRYPIVHLPLSLLQYVVRECRKPCVVVLNKADLVPRHILDRWMAFLPQYFAATGIVAASDAEAAAAAADGDGGGSVVREIPLLPFTSLPAADTAIGAEDAGNAARRQKKKTRRTKLYEQLRTGKLQVTAAPKKGGKRDDNNDDSSGAEDDKSSSSSGELGRRTEDDTYATTDNFKGMRKAERQLQHDRRDHKELQIVSDMISTLLQKCRAVCAEHRNGNGQNKASSWKGNSKDKDHDGEDVVHIGFVGHPNVGKSSLLNCIRGTKVVSVSPTPGHTKHLQTIPLPSERVVLIDSPGLAFPVFGLPHALQAVIGTHQIAQTRDPQSGVAFLASHLQLERLYGLRKEDAADDAAEWSPYEFCESYARKRGYFVKHGKGALDVHRGAIEMLQEAYEGRLVLFLAPPDPAWLRSAAFRAELRPFLLLEVRLPPAGDDAPTEAQACAGCS
ncbi:GTP-binding protein [Trypanosoma grayi]|uniref:GTP-binding protein n=1 Tax=Trypanosoma grayi TaxID=71804 RepID=UPI0004F49E41|nr:GTP-binding protein [Trypanosoma grayi]KEG10690.1 GTP-binding protein [Trypanosoma grayi]